MKSIWEDAYVGKANKEMLAGREIVKNFGNLEQEYQAIREGAMLYDASTYGIFSVLGQAVDEFLERLATKDIQYLNVGNASECLFLTEEAEVVGSVIIIKRERDYCLLVPWEHAQAIKDWLIKQAQDEEEVKIEDLSGQKGILALEGPQTWKIVQQMLPQVNVESLALRMAVEVTDESGEITLMRFGRSSEYGYMIISDADGIKKYYQKAFEIGKKESILVADGGVDVLELAMLEIHQPNFIRETAEFGNVLELDQQWFIQFDKEDYLGQEKLKELFEEGVSKHSVGFVCEKEVEPKTAVFCEGEQIGEVIYTRYSFALKKAVGIALLENPYAQSRMTYGIGEEKMPMETLSAPYVRPLSWDLAME
ncbi:aminomethyltransferase [Clostridia bacterium]|nr:aminomethyltransferase [Clostridia bacterium]